jgi:hypothetical protein
MHGLFIREEIPIPENFHADCLGVVVLKTHHIKTVALYNRDAQSMV